MGFRSKAGMQDLADPIHCAADGRCQRGRACLAGGRPLCRAVDANGPNILFLAGSRPRACPHRADFGGVQICRCPEHFGLFTGSGGRGAAA